MSTEASVRSVWALQVFQNSSITALTTNIYNYDAKALAGESASHNEKLLLDQQYNFIQYRVSKAWENGLTGQVRNQFTVHVQYYKEADIAGAAYLAIGDAFETLIGVVKSQLGENWYSTVDYSAYQSGPVDLGLVRIANVPVWRGSFTFAGFSTVSS